jgi:hypothetical protein
MGSQLAALRGPDNARMVVADPDRVNRKGVPRAGLTFR